MPLTQPYLTDKLSAQTLLPLTIPIPQALSIAGSDSGGGAGIQADLKAFFAQGVFGCSVITAVTAQNTKGITHIHNVPSVSIAAQINAVADDFTITAYKLGMIGDTDAIQTVAKALAGKNLGWCVLDPVMNAKDGRTLLPSDATACLIEQIVPYVDIITPNIPEAQVLTGIRIKGTADIYKAASKLLDMGIAHVIIKGGHLDDNTNLLCSDWVFGADTTPYSLTAPRTKTCHTHGTGCTFSACLTACLAKGLSLSHAIATAKTYTTHAIATPIHVGRGCGPINHWVNTKGL